MSARMLAAHEWQACHATTRRETLRRRPNCRCRAKTSLRPDYIAELGVFKPFSAIRPHLSVSCWHAQRALSRRQRNIGRIAFDKRRNTVASRDFSPSPGTSSRAFPARHPSARQTKIKRTRRMVRRSCWAQRNGQLSNSVDHPAFMPRPNRVE